MNCHMCGASFRAIRTDLPFKIADHAIVVIKDLPVLQCDGCREFLIEDAVMKRVEEILNGIAADSELEVVRFAA